VDRLRQQAAGAGLAIEFDGIPLERDMLLRLIARADCYVSLHRSEGFGYTMAEAMYYGVPVIASGYSGNLEYMTAANSLLVPCEEVFVKNPEGPFQHGSVWGEPNVDAAAAFMREVVERPDEAVARGERGRHSVREKLSAATVAETLRSSFRGGKSAQQAAARPFSRV
jgi:glycosyltransferase involved in cell wall biosynthesis